MAAIRLQSPISQRRSLSELRRVLSPATPKAWSFLAGAGISLPSGLQTARTFSERIAAFLAGSPTDQQEITDLLTTGTAGPARPLRFEQVIRILREVGRDSSLIVLDAFDDPGPPTQLHYFLAEMLRGGSGVMTTNFDSLIERAFLYSRLGRAPRSRGGRAQLVQIHTEFPSRGISVRSTFQWYAEQRQLPTAVLKLHGTLRELGYASGGLPALTQTSTRSSIGATLDAIGRASGTPGLEPSKDRVLRRVVRGRTLCILGYSGSDDFDIIPSLGRAAPTIANVLWIHHGRGRTRVHSNTTGAAQTLLPGTLASAVWGGRVIVIEGETLRIINSLFGVPPAPRPATALQHPPPGARFETLPPYVNMTAAKKLTIRGQIEEEASEPSRAKRSYERAILETRRHPDPSSKVFALVRLAHLARVGGSLRTATQLLRRAETSLRRVHDDDRLSAQYFLAAGNVGLDKTDWPAATRMYRRAITYSRRAGWPRMEATILGNLGLIHRRRGRFATATKYIRQALRIDRRIRDRTGMARDLGNLAAVAHEQGKYRDASRFGRESIALERDMGNDSTLGMKRINLAQALTHLGRSGEARQELVAAKVLVDRFSRPEVEAFYWSAWGLLNTTAGNLRVAARNRERAVTLFRGAARRDALARELLELGLLQRDLGAQTEARASLAEALSLLLVLKNVRLVAEARKAIRTL